MLAAAGLASSTCRITQTSGHSGVVSSCGQGWTRIRQAICASRTAGAASNTAPINPIGWSTPIAQSVHPPGRTPLGRPFFTPNHTLGLPPCRGTGHPLHPAPWQAPVAQLDRVLDYGSRGWEFESLRARQSQSGQSGERRTVWLPCHCEGRSDAASTIKVPTGPAIASLDSR
jgi:hypothetical protein